MISKPSLRGISDVQADYEYPKSGSRGIIAPGPRNSSTVQARSQHSHHWRCPKLTAHSSVRVTGPLKNHQSAAGHECKMMVMVCMCHKVQDKYTWIGYE